MISWKNHMNRKLAQASGVSPTKLPWVREAADGTTVITSTATAFEAK
jgi:hypothetical protein